MSLGAAFIVHAHDAGQWNDGGLRLAPEFYD